MTNYDVSNVNVKFSVHIYDGSNYLMETGTTTAQFTASTISTITVTNDKNIVLYQSSQLSLTLSTPFSLDSSFSTALTSFQIIVPAGFTINANSTCQSTSGVCSFISTTQYSIIGVGLTIINFVITMKEVQLPYFAVQSQSFSISY